MKREEFRYQARLIVGDTGPEELAFVRDSDLNLWMNLAIRRIWNSYWWPFRRGADEFSTIADTGVYTLPVEAATVRVVRDKDSGRVLEYQPERVAMREWPESSRGLPQFWTEEGIVQVDKSLPPRRAIRLLPTPSSVRVVEVRFDRKAPEFEEDGQVAPMPEQFDDAILNWVLSRYYRRMDDVSSAREAEREYLSALNTALTDYDRSPVDFISIQEDTRTRSYPEVRF